MALTLSHTALITPEELARDALASLGLDLSMTGGSPDDQGAYDAAIAAIEDMSSVIRSHVQRDVIVAEHEQSLWRSDWTYDEGQEKYAAYADQWPVVQIETAGYTAAGERILTEDADADVVTYFAGYRRADQDLATLQGKVEGLDTLPPELPGVFRSVCTELTLFRLSRAENKQFGTGSTRQQIGGQVVTVQATDRGFMERTLARLDSERRVAI